MLPASKPVQAPILDRSVKLEGVFSLTEWHAPNTTPSLLINN